MLYCPEYQKQGLGNQIKQISNFCTYCCRRVSTILYQIFEGSAIKNYTANFNLVLDMKKIPQCNQYAYHWEYYKFLTTTSWTMAQKESSLCICSVSNVWRSVEMYNSEDIGIICLLDTVSRGLKEFLFLYNVATHIEKIKITLISR